jgi:hypothetical protein
LTAPSSISSEGAAFFAKDLKGLAGVKKDAGKMQKNHL